MRKRMLTACLLVLTLFLGALPAGAAEIVKEEDSFKKKTISASSENETARYKASKVTGLKTDRKFSNAVANASVLLLQKTLEGEKSGKNVLISPDSVFTAVSMVQNGAAGKTQKEMKKALGGISAKQYSRYLYMLHRRLIKNKNFKYKVANSIWYKKGKIHVKPAYLKKLVSYYGAEVYGAPFNGNTVKDINNWVYNGTNGKIPSIIDRLSPAMRMAVINAVYFKANWADPYGSTSKFPFTNGKGKKKKVKTLVGSERTYVEVNGGTGFVKPYEGGKTAFMALLPPEGTSAEEFVKGLTGTKLINAYRKRKKSGVIVRTRMPEFKYSYSVSLNKPLQKMGMKTSFTRAADFSKMTKNPVCVDEILHKTFIDVNKKGTEAAAVTAVMMKASSAYMPEIEIREVFLDRPFVYAIVDVSSGIPLFLGITNDVK